MKKILLPFYKKGLSLKKYWWHRLFTVLFVASIIIGSLFFWQFFLTDDERPYQQCFDSAWAGYHLIVRQTPDDYNDLWSQIHKCETEHPFHPLSKDLPLTLLSIGILSYLLQLIYYKVFIYIIFGKDNNRTN